MGTDTETICIRHVYDFCGVEAGAAAATGQEVLIVSLAGQDGNIDHVGIRKTQGEEVVKAILKGLQGSSEWADKMLAIAGE